MHVEKASSEASPIGAVFLQLFAVQDLKAMTRFIHIVASSCCDKYGYKFTDFLMINYNRLTSKQLSRSKISSFEEQLIK
jgi:hypothetical protein